METQLNKSAQKIRDMFSDVAPKYDAANTVLSLGVHHLWRRRLIAKANFFSGAKVLDCASGTGDLALGIKKSEPGANVIGSDFCQPMLDEAVIKAKAMNLTVPFQQGDLLALPFAENSFDFLTVSFGLRNVENLDQAFKEMNRVLKPGGKLLVLEFGQPRFAPFRALYNWYSKNVLPKIGGLVTGQEKAYSYLQKSSELFPCAEIFCQQMRSSANFQNCEFESLTGGIAYLYAASKAKA